MDRSLARTDKGCSGIYFSASTDGNSWPNGAKINNIDPTPTWLAALVFNNKLYLFMEGE